MKKVISVFLACLMIAVCIPMSASALDITDGRTIATDTVIGEGTTWNCSSTLIVASGATLTVNGSLNITGESGRLVNYGNVIVSATGTVTAAGTGTSTTGSAVLNDATGKIQLSAGCNFVLAANSIFYNDGNIVNINRMTISGSLYHKVILPASFTEEYIYPQSPTYTRKNLSIDYSIKCVLDSDLETDLGYTDPNNYTSKSDVYVANGAKLFVMIEPKDTSNAGCFVDPARVQITAGGQVLESAGRIVADVTKNENGYSIKSNEKIVYSVIPTNALTVGVASVAYDDVVKLFNVALPRNDAYYTITYDGDVDNVTVEYGKTMSFRVVLSPDYDMSSPEVYVNGEHIYPDEYGYYDLRGTDPVTGKPFTEGEGGIQSEVTITVMGITSNELQNTVTGVVGFIKQIVEVLKEIFEYFRDIFMGDGTGSGSIGDIFSNLGA